MIRRTLMAGLAMTVALALAIPALCRCAPSGGAEAGRSDHCTSKDGIRDAAPDCCATMVARDDSPYVESVTAPVVVPAAWAAIGFAAQRTSAVPPPSGSVVHPSPPLRALRI